MEGTLPRKAMSEDCATDPVVLEEAELVVAVAVA